MPPGRCEGQGQSSQRSSPWRQAVASGQISVQARGAWELDGDGAIILMHDGGGERTQSVVGLETVRRELSAQLYLFRNIFVP